MLLTTLNLTLAMTEGAARPDFQHEVTPLSAPDQSPILKLAVSADTLSPRLASLLALQRAEEPETIILLQEVAARDLIRGLEDGTYDAGIALVATTTVFAMNAQPLWADELALAVPLRSPLLAYPEVPLDALLHYPLLQWCLWACEALSQQVDARFGPETHSVRRSRPLISWRYSWRQAFAVGIAPRSHIARARGWGVAMRPLARRLLCRQNPVTATSRDVSAELSNGLPNGRRRWRRPKPPDLGIHADISR
jgi:hypothetical protein